MRAAPLDKKEREKKKKIEKTPKEIIFPHLPTDVELLEGVDVENLDAGVAPSGDLGSVCAEPHTAHHALA